MHQAHCTLMDVQISNRLAKLKDYPVFVTSTRTEKKIEGSL